MREHGRGKGVGAWGVRGAGDGRDCGGVRGTARAALPAADSVLNAAAACQSRVTIPITA